jgi:DNA-binding NarL/FixJ family response regulator
VREIVDAGVTAVLLHSSLTPETLVASLRAVAAGTVMLPSDLLPRLLSHVRRTSGLGPTGLNARERSVLRLLADGSDTRGIAEDLCFSERTVKNVVHDVLTKLNCRTRAQAVALATREGVI